LIASQAPPRWCLRSWPVIGYYYQSWNRQDAKGAKKTGGTAKNAKTPRMPNIDQVKNQKRFFIKFPWRLGVLGGSNILASLAFLTV